MNYIGQILEFIQRFFIWWVQIMPWEKAIHVRLGKHTRVIGAGVHLRLPFIDRVYVQTTRLRVVQLPPQTVTTADRHAVTIITSLGYTIENIEKLYQTLFHADQTLANIMMAAVAEIVASTNLSELMPAIIEKGATDGLDAGDYGLKFDYVKVTGFAVVKAYRLIQDGHWLPDGLDTSKQKV